MNYPRPWLGGRWTFADVVEHHRLAADGLLDAAAAHREMLQRNFYLMNRRTIERFAKGKPYAFLVPRAQHDPATAAHLLRLRDPDTGLPLSDDLLTGEFGVYFAAGIESAGNAMSWTLCASLPVLARANAPCHACRSCPLAMHMQLPLCMHMQLALLQH